MKGWYLPLDVALFTLLHILVFVYWLGGDLGAFYSSHFLTASDVSADRQLMAAKIVNDVDMAPRSALILTLPTGVLLAISANWVTWPITLGWAIAAASLAWLALAWYLHLRHGETGAVLNNIDLLVRVSLLIGLMGYGAAGLLQALEVPFFMATKMLLLAGAILTGLLIRRVLVPLGPALAGLSSDHPEEARLTLAATLNKARPLVVVIWALIISAAFIGIWKPNLV